MQRYKVVVEYDGSGFCGWQKQDGFKTVQGVLEEAVAPLERCVSSVSVYGAGRTDTGVHALGQVAHFDLEKERDSFSVMQCMNSNLRCEPVSILSIEKVGNDFHARFSAKQREYCYIILNRRSKPTVEAKRVWWVVKDLDDKAMNEAAQILVGKHDFSSFRAQGCQALSPIKTIDKISVIRNENKIYINVAAPSFLYHQVRNIVGSLCNVGTGRWKINDFKNIFEAKDRKLAGVTAPAEGLYFKGVLY